jgi:hypothetical protein
MYIIEVHIFLTKFILLYQYDEPLKKPNLIGVSFNSVERLYHTDAEQNWFCPQTFTMDVQWEISCFFLICIVGGWNQGPLDTAAT